MQQPSVKVCGITRSEDAQFALKCGASKLGFILYEKSPRSVGFDEIEKIKKEVNFPVDKMVVVEVEPDIEYLKRIQAFGFGNFQFHFSHDLSRRVIEKWTEIIGVENLWLAPRIPMGLDFPRDLLCFANTFLVDAFSDDKFGGTGVCSDWEKFSVWQNSFSEKKWILAGGLSPVNIQLAIKNTNAQSLDVNSGVELSPGVKDHQKIREFFKKIS